jgi:hypothetical protein
MKEVMLSPAEETTFRALTVDKNNAMKETDRLKQVAREAAKAHRLADKQFRRIQAVLRCFQWNGLLNFGHDA